MSFAHDNPGRTFGGLVFGLVLGVVLLGSGVWLVWHSPGVLPRAGTGVRDGFSLAELALLEPGDIILRRSVGLTGDLIVGLLHDGTGASHGAMVLAVHPPGQIILIQSINASLSGIDGVQTQELADFSRYNAPESLVVSRPRWSGAFRQKALQATGQLLVQRLPFDNAYNFADRSAVYCSEMLWYILELSGWLSGGPQAVLQQNVLSFRSFLDPAYFRIIISHNPAIVANGP